METLRQTLRPEFLNRIDETVIFEPLGREEIAAIVKIREGHLIRRLGDKRITLTLTPAAEEVRAREGYDPGYGARPLSVSGAICRPDSARPARSRRAGTRARALRIASS
jgi:ATP-dependent Clp protease ATP-binding subunit ClpB